MRADVGARQFGTGPVGPQRHVVLLENLEGGGQVGRRRLLLAHSALELAEQQKRPGTVERHRDPLVVRPSPGAPPRARRRGRPSLPASCFGRARRPRTSTPGRTCGRYARASRSGVRLRRACPTAQGPRWRRAGTRHRAVRSVSTPDRRPTAAAPPRRPLPHSCPVTPPRKPGCPTVARRVGKSLSACPSRVHLRLFAELRTPGRRTQPMVRACCAPGTAVCRR